MREKVTVAAETNPYLQERLNEAIRREQETAKRIRLAQAAAERRAMWREWRDIYVVVGATVAMIHFFATIFSTIGPATARSAAAPVAAIESIFNPSK